MRAQLTCSDWCWSSDLAVPLAASTIAMIRGIAKHCSFCEGAIHHAFRLQIHDSILACMHMRALLTNNRARIGV
jgi:hypothetical protein